MTTDKGRKNSQLQDLQRQEGGGMLVSTFGVLLGTMEQRPRVVRDIVYACVVLHNMMTHQGGEDRAPNPGNDGAALQNNQAVCVPKQEYRNPSREAKH